MQKINQTMNRVILNTFSSYGPINQYQTPNRSITNYENNSYFNHFFRVKLTEDKFEIPIYARSVVKDYIYKNGNNQKDFIMPFITCIKIPPAYRTADSLIKSLTFFTASLRSSYLAARSYKGELYYGTDGIIFNKDMVPLLFNVLEAHRNSNNRIVYTKAKCYIHPSVFYTDGIVEKCIINKILPSYMQNGIYINIDNINKEIDNLSGNNSNYYSRVKPEVIVKDIGDTFICKPIAPPVTFNNEDINQFLINNIDDIANFV